MIGGEPPRIRDSPRFSIATPTSLSQPNEEVPPIPSSLTEIVRNFLALVKQAAQPSRTIPPSPPPNPSFPSLPTPSGIARHSQRVPPDIVITPRAPLWERTTLPQSPTPPDSDTAWLFSPPVAENSEKNGSSLCNSMVKRALCQSSLSSLRMSLLESNPQRAEHLLHKDISLTNT